MKNYQKTTFEKTPLLNGKKREKRIKFLLFNFHLLDELIFSLETTTYGNYWEIFDALVNLLLVVLYIYNTTLMERCGSQFLSLSLSTLLLFQYVVRHLILSTRRLRNLFSYLFFLTILTTFPVFIAFSQDCLKDTYMSSGIYAYVFPFRFLRLHYSIIQCLVPSKTSIFRLSLVARKGISLCGFIFFLILTVAAFVHITQYKNENAENITFFDAFFFCFVSSVSGLTSSVVPDNIFSRFVILYIMITGIIYIPPRAAELLRLIQQKSDYDGSYFWDGHREHVILCGYLELSSIKTFLHEFFCIDHGSVTLKTDVVLLDPNEPDEELSLLLNNPVYCNSNHIF